MVKPKKHTQQEFSEEDSEPTSVEEDVLPEFYQSMCNNASYRGLTKDSKLLVKVILTIFVPIIDEIKSDLSNKAKELIDHKRDIQKLKQRVYDLETRIEDA